SIEVDVKGLKDSNPDPQSTQSGQDRGKATVYPNSVKWDPNVQELIAKSTREKGTIDVAGTRSLDEGLDPVRKFENALAGSRSHLQPLLGEMGFDILKFDRFVQTDLDSVPVALEGVSECDDFDSDLVDHLVRRSSSGDLKFEPWSS
ncbi:hypothetical protein BGZ83_001972, partial [Gryganskiella cystojenkinii]